MSLQEDAVVDAGWELFLIVSNHDHRLVLSLAECLDDILYQAAVSVVKTMKRLVEDEELRLIDKSRDESYLLLVACAKVAYQLFLIHYFASHEGFYIF